MTLSPNNQAESVLTAALGLVWTLRALHDLTYLVVSHVTLPGASMRTGALA